MGKMFLANFRYVSLICILLFGLMTIVGTGGGDDGGGGGGDNNQWYDGLTTPVEITEDNADNICVGAYTGMQRGSATNFIAIAPGEVENMKAISRGVMIIELLDRIDIASIVSRRTLSAETITETLPGNCGGRATLTGTGNEQTGVVSGNIQFNSFCNDGLTMSGSVGFTMQINMSTSQIQSLSMTYNSVLCTYDSESFSLNGNSNIIVSYSENSISLTMDMVTTDSTTNKTYWFKDYTITTAGGYQTSVKISGTYYDPDYGYVNFSTTEDFIVSSVSGFPTDGTMVLEGAAGSAGGNTKAKLIAYPTFFEVHADTNGDGEYDYYSGQLSWSNF